MASDRDAPSAVEAFIVREGHWHRNRADDEDKREEEGLEVHLFWRI